MARKTVSTMEYIQSKGELKSLEKHCKELECSNPLIILDRELEKIIEIDLKKTSTYLPNLYLFEGESSENNIKLIENSYKKTGSDIIVGVGGGKVADTAKAVANNLKSKVIISPTSASTNASCSRLSVLYHDDTKFNKYLKLRKNPEKIIVDTKIVSSAPKRLTVSGIGDALATYFEASACFKSGALNFLGTSASKSALVSARGCYETLIKDSKKALKDIEDSKITTEVENLIEANIYLSSIGSESAGLAAAHSIHNGMTKLEDSANYLHGELVAIAIIIQLVLEKRSKKFIRKLLKFYKSIGLPTSLNFIKTKKDIATVAKESLKDSESIHNMPFKIKKDDLETAILKAIKIMK